jgi:hypothetical protein
VRSWSFTTSEPRLVSIEPAPFSTPVRLDQEVTLTFNQPMDSDSVTGNFSLLGTEGEAVIGTMDWNEDFTEFTFTPTDLYPRFTRFTVLLPASTQARGGTQLGEDFQSSFTTSPELGVIETEPRQGGVNPVYNGVTLRFSSQLPEEDLLEYITISPRVPDLTTYLMEERALGVWGNFSPATSYTLTVSDQLQDVWGGRMEEPYILEFSTANLDPDLQVTMGTDVLFMTSQENSLFAQATNISSLQVAVGNVPLEDFLLMLGPNGWDIRQTYQPRSLSTLTQSVSLPPNRSQVVEVSLTPDNQPVAPGLYYIKMDIGRANYYGGNLLLVSSDVHLTFKSSKSDVFVWAVNLRDQSPVAGAPVTVYDENGSILARGITDGEGIFYSASSRSPSTHLPLPSWANRESQTLAWRSPIGALGLTLGFWHHPRLQPLRPEDLLIYRPADLPPRGYRLFSAWFHGRPRVGFMCSRTPRHKPSAFTMGWAWSSRLWNCLYRSYGTANGEYTLLPEAQPGYYRLGEGDDALWFKVADYRKPEINLQVAFDKEEILADEKLSATLNARYFFDAPVSNLEVHWAVYAAPENYVLPGYQVGPMNINWFYPRCGCICLVWHPWASWSLKGKACWDAMGSWRWMSRLNRVIFSRIRAAID